MKAGRQGGTLFVVLKTTLYEFIDDECPALAAALAYYTLFSLPALLMIVVATTGAVFGPESAADALRAQAGDLIGEGASRQVQNMLADASNRAAGAGWQALIGAGALLFGATTAFAQLQAALNRTWELQADPKAGGVRMFVVQRLLSFALILVLSLLLLVSLAISAAISAAGNSLESLLGGAISVPVLAVINNSASLLITTALFGAMFKYLPDARLAWRTVMLGAFLTALLFMAGKTLLAWYFTATDVAGAYGAAGSVILILVWIYYSSMIVLLGAEFTHAWAIVHGQTVVPRPGAVHLGAPPQSA